MDFKNVNLDMHLKDARSKLFKVYIGISVTAIVFYTVLFYQKGIYPAAIIQAVFAFLFIGAYVLYDKGYKLFSITTSIMLSDAIVVLQTFYLFTREAGFHFQLLALMIIVFLVTDLYYIREKAMSVILAAITGLCLFFCQWLALEPLSTTRFDIDTGLMMNASIFITMTAIIALLYTYSVQLSMKEKALSYMAKNDALTGVSNRAHFTEKGNLFYDNHIQFRNPFSVIIIDVDDFKVINDTYGHAAGDHVLVTIAAVMKSFIKDSQVFARYGGEEFALLLPDMNKDQALTLAEDIRIAIEKLVMNYDTTPLRVTISLGVATLSSEHHSFDSLIIEADRNLYVSKHNGKNQTSI